MDPCDGCPIPEGYRRGVFTGRREEVTRVAEALVDDRQAIVVAGPAGIGKSTLCRQAVSSRVGERPDDWRSSGGLASMRWVPFLVYRRIIGEKVRESPDLVAAQVLRMAPRGLILDDLQWADDLSLEVTATLVGRIPLLVTVRTGDARAPATLEALELVGFRRLDLEPLDEPESRRLVADLHPELSAEAHDRIVRQAAGNPLLLGELGADRAVTPTLVRALQARLDELPSVATRAMRRLSVLGHPATAELVGPGAADLVESGLANVVDGLLEVRHALLAELVVDDLGAGADDVRRELADEVDAQEAAFLLAPTGDRQLVRSTALRAAEGAEGLRAKAELLALAVASAPGGDLDPCNRLAAARLFSRMGTPARALELCSVDGVEALPALERGRMRAGAAEALWLLGRVDEFAKTVERAVDDLRGSRTQEEVDVLAGSTIVDTRIHFDGRPAVERAQEAVALAEEIDGTKSFALFRLASVYQSVGDPRHTELLQRALHEATREGDDFNRLVALEGVVIAAWLGDGARAALDAVEPIVAAGPAPEIENTWWSVVALAALLSYQAGIHREQVVDRWSVVLHDEPLFRNRTFVMVAVGLCLAELGRHGRAAEVLEGVDRRDLDPQLRALGLWGLAAAAWHAGRVDDVIAAHEAVDALGTGDYPPSARIRVLANYARRDAGMPMVGAEPAVTVPSWQGSPIEWRALQASVGDHHDLAVRLFDDAAHAWARHDSGAMLRCRWAAGDSARLAGLPDAADRLTGVEHAAEAIGNLSLAARARRSLRDLGVVRQSGRGAAPLGLTIRQAEVLERVGDGLTSAEIAAELHVSVSTVNSLVRAAVQRLGAANRRVAAAQLRAARESGVDRPGGPPAGELSSGQVGPAGHGFGG